MSLKKLLSIRRNRIIAGVAAIAVVLAAGITAACVHHWSDRHERSDAGAARAGYELLYLQNTSSHKLTPAQARALEPLMEQLAAATDRTAADALQKDIVAQLTPEQYYDILSNTASTGGKNRSEHGRDHEGGMFMGKESRDGTASTTDTVVIRMLKDLSAR